MSLRERSELADQRDVKKLLTEYEEFSGVTQELDEIAMEGIGEELMADLNWRAGHYGIKINYWELVASDDNSQLSAGSSVNPFYLQDMRSMLQLDRQSVSNIPFFESAHIIRFPFRCFHRSDGEYCSFRCDLSTILKLEQASCLVWSERRGLTSLMRDSRSISNNRQIIYTTMKTVQS